MLSLLKSGQQIYCSGLFDARFYHEQQQLLQQGELYALAHYLLLGRTLSARPNPLFCPLYYLEQNNIPHAEAASPLEHFIALGAHAGFRTSNLFDWLKFGKERELGESGIAIMRHALLHGDFVRYGLSEIEEFQIGVTEPLSFPVLPNPRVSIVVATENPLWTFQILKSIRDTLVGFSYEVILLNSSETNHQAMDFVCSSIAFVDSSKSGSALNALSEAFQIAQGEYLLLLPGYAVVSERSIEMLVEVLDNCPQAAMVGPRLVNPDGRICDAGKIMHGDGRIETYGAGLGPEAFEANYRKAVDGLSPACLLIRKDVWLKANGFADSFVSQDYAIMDFAFRLRAMGHETIYEPKSVVVDLRNTGDVSFPEGDRKTFYRLWQEQLTKDHSTDCGGIFTTRDRQRKVPTILVIDSHVPHFDRDAGSRHTFQYLKWFIEQGFNVKFLGDNYFPHQPYTGVLQQLGIEVLYGPWIAEHWGDWLHKNSQDLDYIYLHRPEVARKYLRVAATLKGPKLLYFGHDLHGMRLRRQYEVEKKEILLVEAKDKERIEYEVFRMVDAIYYPSFVEIDEILQREPGLNARAIPLYLVDEIPERAHCLEQRRDLLFVGGFRHSPNVDAMHWFVDAVMPLILQRLEDVNLNIVGSNMPQSIRDLERPHVRIVGEVTEEELLTLYDSSRVCVVPLRYGAGIKGKVLEALEWQIPVVTTGIGAEGLRNAEEYMVVADEADSFARGVVQLYTDEAYWRSVVQRGRTALTSDFSKDLAYNIMRQDIDFPLKKGGLGC